MSDDEATYPQWSTTVKPSDHPVLTEKLLKKYIVRIRTQLAVDAARRRIHGDEA